ncbi:MAG: DUF2157 domain-containing protein [Planctomycetota bacterium]
MECLNPETIEGYVKKSIRQQEQTTIEDHLKECPKCRETVNDALENESLLLELHTHQFTMASSAPDPLSLRPSPMTTAQAQEIVSSQYTIVKRIGRGASGEVFQAMDPALERPVAIKFLRPETAVTAWQTDQWREGKFMSRVDHPHIAHIYHIGEHDGVRYIVMEWIDGLPLTQAWEKESLAKRLNLYLQILEAIDTAHRKGIVHRDIKPSNILVTAAGQVKVLDFGIAMAVDRGRPDEPNVYRGTPAYSAPEQVSIPDKIGPATDVFALGILLYQLLTDTLPFPQTDSRQLFEAICTQHPDLPTAIRETVPLPLQNICLKALEKDICNRYRDANALAGDVSRFLRGEKVWSRPSFVNDQIQQEIFYHRQRLEVWHHNGLVTEKEHDKLENIYERVVAPSDLSIIESRTLSFSQVCLYLGGWIVAIGCSVLFYKSWDKISIYWRPAPAIFATLLISIFGVLMWRKNERRLAVGFLATANLLIPATILLTMGQWNILSPISYPWGTESMRFMLENIKSYLIVGNVQLYTASWCWLAISLVFVRLTRSSIFMIFTIVAFLVWLSICYVTAGMIGSPDTSPWEVTTVAFRYLYPGMIIFALGVFSDRHKRLQYAWPLCLAGLAVIVLCLSVLALEEEMLLFHWSFLNQGERILLGFAANGILYLLLATVCRTMGTRLQRTLAQILNWLGPLHVLSPLRILDIEDIPISIPESHQLVYRILLPIASFSFVFGSVARQMKSFFFTGLVGLAAAVHKLTNEYFKNFFAWPISLIVSGLMWMFFSWLVPRFRARRALKRE